MLESLYAGLERGLDALDRRALDYRYDLDRDVPWSRIAEPGLFLPPDLVRDLGFDVDGLRAHPGAWEMFQWAGALGVSEGFIVAERQVLDFLEAEPVLLGHRSNALLDAEERKHIAMFRRFADHLREARPDWLLAFDRVWSASGCDADGLLFLRAVEEPRLYHAAFWAALVFFEEATVYIHHRLRRRDEVQPCWQAVHEMHMREEVQHILTDVAHVRAARVSGDERRRIGTDLAGLIARELDRTFGVRAALALVAGAFPGIRAAPRVPASETPVYHDVLHHPIFRRTRDDVLGWRP